MCNYYKIFQRSSLTFWWKYRFAYLSGVRFEDHCHSHICTLNHSQEACTVKQNINMMANWYVVTVIKLVSYLYYLNKIEQNSNYRHPNCQWRHVCIFIFTHFVTHHLSQEFPYVMRTSLILNNIKHMLCKLPLILLRIVDT